MNRQKAEGGYTLIEVMVSIGLSLMVALALGSVITTSVKLWNAHLDKASLQSNTTLAANWIRRDVQGAHALGVSSEGFLTYDRFGARLHTYQRAATAEGPRLLRDGQALVPDESCEFTVSTNIDTTNVQILMGLENRDGARANTMVTVAVRDQTQWF